MYICCLPKTKNFVLSTWQHVEVFKERKKLRAFPLCYDLVVILNKGFIKGSGRDRNLKESNRLISKVIFKKLYYTGSYYFNEKRQYIIICENGVMLHSMLVA